MSIREASPLGQYQTLPGGGEGLAPSAIQAHGPPEPPKSCPLPSAASMLVIA